jgi:hypothetical protein
MLLHCTKDITADFFFFNFSAQNFGCTLNGAKFAQDLKTAWAPSWYC